MTQNPSEDGGVAESGSSSPSDGPNKRKRIRDRVGISPSEQLDCDDLGWLVRHEIMTSELRHSEVAEKYGLDVCGVIYLMKWRRISFAAQYPGEPSDSIGNLLEKAGMSNLDSNHLGEFVECKLVSKHANLGHNTDALKIHLPTLLASRFLTQATQENDMPSQMDWLLCILQRDGPKVEGRTRVMKLAFLLDRAMHKKNLESPFSFIQYKYGPFDKDILESLEQMEGEGLVYVSEESTPYGPMYVYELTEDGKEKAKEIYDSLGFWEKRLLRDNNRRWGDTDTQSIIGFIYDSYPEFAPSVS